MCMKCSRQEAAEVVIRKLADQAEHWGHLSPYVVATKHAGPGVIC